MGKLKFLGFLLLPLTINPHGPFFLIWCIFRIICINFIGLILPPYVATVPYLNYLLYPTIIAIVTVYVDMYILLHVAYYNEDGILITHPKHTAKYYLTHSFIVDLISAFPVQLFIKWFNPEHDESHDPIMHMVYPHFMHCSWMFNLPLQLHRMLGLIRYLESNISLNSDIVRSLKLFTPIIIIMNCISSLAFNYECDYKFYNFKKRGKFNHFKEILDIFQILFCFLRLFKMLSPCLSCLTSVTNFVMTYLKLPLTPTKAQKWFDTFLN